MEIKATEFKTILLQFDNIKYELSQEEALTMFFELNKIFDFEVSLKKH